MTSAPDPAWAHRACESQDHGPEAVILEHRAILAHQSLHAVSGQGAIKKFCAAMTPAGTFVGAETS